MSLLLDTLVFIWWRENSPRLSSEVKMAVRDADVVFVSMASVWEIAIKTSVGKLRISGPVAAGILSSNFEPLPVQFSHVDVVEHLPFHHRDPFDRMLVAQCRVEGLTLVTGDRRLEPYDIPFLWL